MVQLGLLIAFILQAGGLLIEFSSIDTGREIISRPGHFYLLAIVPPFILIEMAFLLFVKANRTLSIIAFVMNFGIIFIYFLLGFLISNENTMENNTYKVSYGYFIALSSILFTLPVQLCYVIALIKSKEQ